MTQDEQSIIAPQMEEIAEPAQEPPPSSARILYGRLIPPQQQILLYSSDEWERFIHEWVHYQKSKYKRVARLSGAGDMGIDVAGFTDGHELWGVWDNYQCKHYAASLVRNEKASPPEAKLDTSFKPNSFAVTTFEMAHLRGKLDAAMGTGTTDRALFSPFGYRVAFGTVYAFKLDGQDHLIWDGGTPHRSLGTDAFVFRLAAQTISPIGNARGLYVLPLPAKPARLTVHKAIEPNGKPWSEFDGFASLVSPLKALKERR